MYRYTTGIYILPSQWWLDLMPRLAWWLACCELSIGTLVSQRSLEQQWKAGELKKP